MYTEDEAREKWCPHALRRHDAVNVETCGRGVRDEPITFCIGSACMAWRWSENAVLDRARTKDMRDNNYPTVQEQARSHTGYCGLSDSPYMGGE